MKYDKVTIGLIGECYDLNGKSLWPAELSKAFNKIDGKFDIKLFMRDDAPYDSDKFVKVKTFKTKIRVLSGFGYYIPLFFKLLKAKNIDIIHACDEKTSALASLVKKPLIATVPDITPINYKFPFNCLFKIIYSFLNKATKIMVLSNSTDRKLISEYPRLSKKTVAIHQGVDTQRFKPTKKIRSYVTIGVLGDYDEDLNFVFRKILNEQKNVRVILGGRISEKFHHLNSHPRIHVKGIIKPSELPKHYQEIDIFVYKTFSEGFGLIPVEAMSSGCAIVASNVDSLPESIKDAGLLVKNTREEFYNAINTLIKNKNLLLRYQKKGRKRAKELTWEQCAKKHAKLYEKVLATIHK
jgi:glycosyltransferase involved in cell wall biosynthesis